MKKLIVSGLAAAAIGCALCACSPQHASSNAPASWVPSPAVSAGAAGTSTEAGGSGASVVGAEAPMRTGVTNGPGRYILESMAAGTVQISHGSHGRLQARVEVFGLTPGSSHQVSIDGPTGELVRFPALTADAAGQANVALTSAGSTGVLPPASRFVIRLGDGGGDPMAADPIA